MRDIIDITDEVLSLSNVDILILFGLIIEKTAFRFTSEDWDAIADKIANKDTLPQIDDLMKDVVLLSDDDIKYIFLTVKTQKGLPHPIIPTPIALKNPVFVSKSHGKINKPVFHLRKKCSANNPLDKNSFIDTVERSEIEGFIHVCPICVLEKNKN